MDEIEQAEADYLKAEENYAKKLAALEVLRQRKEQAEERRDYLARKRRRSGFAAIGEALLSGNFPLEEQTLRKAARVDPAAVVDALKQFGKPVPPDILVEIKTRAAEATRKQEARKRKLAEGRKRRKEQKELVATEPNTGDRPGGGQVPSESSIEPAHAAASAPPIKPPETANGGARNPPAFRPPDRFPGDDTSR